jgi:hypothetical protein
VNSHKLPLVAALTVVWGCSSPERAPSERTSRALPAETSTLDESAAEAEEPDLEPSPVVKGPYKWPPGRLAGDPNHFEPKYSKCTAFFTATPAPDFPNPYDSIRGPIDIAYLRDLKVAGHNLFHDDWTGRAEMVTAGANARVTVFPKENFGGESHTIEPGEHFRLEDSPLDQVASLKIEYVP